MYPRQINRLKKHTATYGIPKRLIRVKILGARPSRARPNNVREPPRRPELPALQALVKTIAFIIDGTTLMPALVAAITNGDCAAIPVDLRRLGSFEGTTSPTMKVERTEGS